MKFLHLIMVVPLGNSQEELQNILVNASQVATVQPHGHPLHKRVAIKMVGEEEPIICHEPFYRVVEMLSA